jgi:MFS family permease
MADLWSSLSAASTLLFGAFETLFASFALAAGLIALFYGRRFFWIFLAIAGFMVGLALSDRFVAPFVPWVQTVLALAIAVGLAALALGIQRVLSVFAGAALFGLGVWAWMNGSPQWAQIAMTAFAALVGALLMFYYFDWTLILISVVVGGGITLVGISRLITVPAGTGLWVGLILAAAGIWYQYKDLQTIASVRKPAVRYQPLTPRGVKPQPLPQPIPQGAAQGMGLPEAQALPAPSAAARVR